MEVVEAIRNAFPVQGLCENNDEKDDDTHDDQSLSHHLRHLVVQIALVLGLANYCKDHRLVRK